MGIRVNLRRWDCIGCGKPRAKRRYRYCRVCQRRLDRGETQLDRDDILTKVECLEAIKRFNRTPELARS